MMHVKRFTNMNAGEMREFLEQQYAEWVLEGFKSPEWIRRFMRRIAILADVLCLPKEQVLGQVSHIQEVA